MDRAEALAAEDRALLRAFLEDGSTCTDLARIAGITRGRMRRRLARLITRVMSEEFRFVRSRVAGAAGDLGGPVWGPVWGQVRRAVATVHFLHGRSIRDTASALGVSVHRVRRHIDQIRDEFELAEGRGT